MNLLLLCNNCGSVFNVSMDSCRFCNSKDIVKDIDDLFFPMVEALIKKGYVVLSTYRDNFVTVNEKMTDFRAYIQISRHNIYFDAFEKVLDEQKRITKLNLALTIFDVMEDSFKIGLKSVSGDYSFVFFNLYTLCYGLKIWTDMLFPCTLKENSQIEGETEVEITDVPLEGRCLSDS